MGGDPKYPELLSLIYLSQSNYTELFPSVVEKFEIEFDNSITTKMLSGRRFTHQGKFA